MISFTKTRQKMLTIGIIITAIGFITMLTVDWRIDFALLMILWGQNIEREWRNPSTELMSSVLFSDLKKMVQQKGAGSSTGGAPHPKNGKVVGSTPTPHV